MNNLEQKREELGMTPVDFAHWLGVSPTTYRKILTGNVVNMYVDTFIKIRQMTKLNLDEYVDIKKTFKALQGLNN